MANIFKFPGVYANIKDLSGVVNMDTTTACAYVGEAEFGPVYKPTLLSSLQDYLDRFGSLSSEYGYAGYSLAVASETIPQHQFVRVVPRGNGENDAKWASASILVSDSDATGSDEDYVESSTTTPSGRGNIWNHGLYYTNVIEAEELRDAGSPCGLFKDNDIDNAIVFTATDPNKRTYCIDIDDSTVNLNKAYKINSMTVTPFLELEKEYTKVTLVTASDLLSEAHAGDPIVIKKMRTDAFNGNFVVGSINGEDEEGYTTLTYTVEGKYETIADDEFKLARVGRYPYLKDTTFSVTLYEKDDSGSYTTLETYENCTLFAKKNSYGDSIFIEDVINGTSNYIEVFTNTNFTAAEEAFAPKFVEKLELKGGTSGSWEDTSDKISDLCEAWELFRDRSQVPASLLMNCGYVTSGDIRYQKKMLEIAEYRRDCFCLFDVPMTQTDYDDLIEWRKDVQAFDTYRGAISSPWVKTYDSAQGRSNFVMCPSAYMAKIMGTYDPWIAPAGLNRGVLSSTTVSPTGLTQYYNLTQGGSLYTDNQINCIIRDPGTGYVNWGQRTLQRKASAMDRINVARTIIYIETVLRDAAKYHLFENNTTYERTQITLQFNNFLNTVLCADGIQKFVVQCDSENNPASVIEQNRLVIDIYIWPTYTAEVININTTVEGADINVQVTSTN